MTELPSSRPLIICNAIRCNQRGEEIENRHRHDYVRCRCGNAGVNAGLYYLRRTHGPAGFTELARHADPN